MTELKKAVVSAFCMEWLATAVFFPGSVQAETEHNRGMTTVLWTVE